MPDERAASGLARLAGMLRAEATNGLFWGADGDESARLRELRACAAALLAEVDARPAAWIESVFDDDEGLRTPMPGTELRVACGDGETVVVRRRLRRGGESLGERLEAAAAALGTAPPPRPVGVGDTDLAGLSCPHTFLLAYELACDLDAAAVRAALGPGDGDLEGAVDLLGPAEASAGPERGPVPVPASAAAILAKVAELSAAGLASAGDYYGTERHRRIAALCADTVPGEGAYPRIDRGDIAHPGVPTGAEAAVFDERGRILLIRRTDTGEWAMPGGACEVGETVALAAVREVAEESGLDVELTDLLWAFDKRDVRAADSRMPVIMSFAARRLDPEQPVRLQALEASDHRWVAREEVGGIDFYRGHELRVPAAFAAGGRAAAGGAAS